MRIAKFPSLIIGLALAGTFLGEISHCRGETVASPVIISEEKRKIIEEAKRAYQRVVEEYVKEKNLPRNSFPPILPQTIIDSMEKIPDEELLKKAKDPNTQEVFKKLVLDVGKLQAGGKTSTGEQVSYPPSSVPEATSPQEDASFFVSNKKLIVGIAIGIFFLMAVFSQGKKKNKKRK